MNLGSFFAGFGEKSSGLWMRKSKFLRQDLRTFRLFSLSKMPLVVEVGGKSSRQPFSREKRHFLSHMAAPTEVDWTEFK